MCSFNLKFLSFPNSVNPKLYLTQSFYQVELEESSRYITTFVCHKGLYRYKRLMFGINSAPELHQKIVQQTIQDIPGCSTALFACRISTHKRTFPEGLGTTTN
jgi:hypothetical protein